MMGTVEKITLTGGTSWVTRLLRDSPTTFRTPAMIWLDSHWIKLSRNIGDTFWRLPREAAYRVEMIIGVKDVRIDPTWISHCDGDLIIGANGRHAKTLLNWREMTYFEADDNAIPVLWCGIKAIKADLREWNADEWPRPHPRYSISTFRRRQGCLERLAN